MIKNLFFTICTFACLCLTTIDSSAQLIDNRGSMFHVGISLGGYSYAGAISLPAVGVSYDRGLKDDLGPGHLSVGGVIGFKVATDKYSIGGTNYRYNYRNTFIGARVLYHWDVLNQDKWNIYGGLVLGARLYRYGNTFDSSFNSSSFNVLLGGIIGGQYFFTDKIGAFIELGNGIGYTTIGASFKL